MAAEMAEGDMVVRQPFGLRPDLQTEASATREEQK